VSARGRPRLVGAVDVGATKTLAAVARLPLVDWAPAGRIVRMATPREPAALVEAVAAALVDLAAEAGGPLAAVGVGTPGPLDAAHGIVLHSPNQGWHDVPLGPLLAERLGVPVGLDDDANSGALGEARMGAGRGADPVAYVTVSTGIGAGIVADGHVLRGAHGAAGEVGHLVVDAEGPRCGCGRRGCVEAFASGGGLERRARAAWPGARRADGSPAPRTAAEVLLAARAGEGEARRLVADGEAALGLALAALIAAVDPERIVVGGSLGLAHRAYVGRAASRARRLTIGGGRVVVVRAKLGAECVLAGAAVVGMDLAGAGVG
jgi:glucokinase